MVTIETDCFTVPQICESGQCFRLDAFPVDTHIRQALESQYAGGFPFDRYKGCAGVMQQYIFYYDLKGRRK